MHSLNHRSSRALRACLTGAVLALLELPTTSGAAGVTVIAHGFQSGSDTWVSTMANAIAQRLGGPASVSQYTMVIRNTGEPLNPVISLHSFTLDPGSTSLNSLSRGEVIVKVCWSDIDGGVPCINNVSTRLPAAIVAYSLMLPVATDGSLSRPLTEFPIHLIGHSRGGSLMCEVARILGTNGIWVDQLTTLDPHPLELCQQNLDDAPALVYENVLFADNIWEYEENGGHPNGRYIYGAFNRFLQDSVVSMGGYGGPFGAHSDVHLWYHGTIDLNTPASYEDGGTILIDESMRTNWWLPSENRGTNAGFYYSRLGGGNRFSGEQPAGSGTGTISDGIHSQILYGGPAYNRTELNVNASGTWPNLISLTHDATSSPVAISNAVRFTYVYQDYANGCTNTIYLDTDRNPYNGTVRAVGTNIHLATSKDTPAGTLVWNATEAPTGTFYVFAKMSDATVTRYLYAQDPLTIVTNNGVACLTAPTLLPPVGGMPGQSVNPIFSWTPVNGATSYRIMIATNAATLPVDPTDRKSVV